MQELEALWKSSAVLRLALAHDVGGLFRLVRRVLGYRQLDVARAVGCSASTVSRLESGSRSSLDLALIQAVAEFLELPPVLLGVALGLDGGGRHTVDLTSREDAIHRRQFLTAAGLVLPTIVLKRLDAALALPSGAGGSALPAATALMKEGRALFDTGNHAGLMALLPDLVTAARRSAAYKTQDGYLSASMAYCLATEALAKVEQLGSARLTADRAMICADAAESAVAGARAARALSIVLRHQGDTRTATEVTLRATAAVERDGLRTAEEASTYAQMLCTHAYVAARAGDRPEALEAMTEATAAVAHLQRSFARQGGFTLAALHLYQVGVHWALGDAGTAIDSGRKVDLAELHTRERRARYYTDMARAWWQWDKADETVRMLLAAYNESPGELRDRPALRRLVEELQHRYPRTRGVSLLAGALKIER